MRTRVFVCACFALIAASFSIAWSQEQDINSPRGTRITLNYDVGLERCIELGGYDRVDPYINSDNFPAPKAGFNEVEILVLRFGRIVTDKEVEETASRYGWRLANIYELLSVGNLYPDEQRKYPLVALGSVATDEYGISSVAYLWGDEKERTIDRSYLGHSWHSSCRFLVVKPKPEKGLPMCSECSSYGYCGVRDPFTCKNCKEKRLGAHGGIWHYCDACAEKLSRCTLCGKEIKK